MKARVENSLILFFASLVLVAGFALYGRAAQPAAGQPAYIKWVDFGIPCRALQKAMEIDVKTHTEEDETVIDWIELLSLLGCQYGGSWNSYQAADMDRYARELRAGRRAEDLAVNKKNYQYFLEAYGAVLGQYLGVFEKQVKDKETGRLVWEQRYGLKAYSPVAEGYGYSHYRDFGNSRGYGYQRRHLGNDLMGTVGTPIIAVEGGTVESAGWNQYGGWRVGVRSHDRTRYYYYAHLRKDTPFHASVKEGETVKAGDVIGYLGMTGYSAQENVNGMKAPHLHFGVQLIFDESQKDGVNQIWIDVYELVNFLEQNRASVERREDGHWYRLYNVRMLE